VSERPIITVTEAARTVVGAMRAAEPDGDELALRVSVIGVGEGGHEYAYELVFDPVADVKPGDELRWSGELPVVVPEDSVERLWGAVLDNVEPTGLVIRNPNRPRPEPAAPIEVELTGTPEEKLRTLLDGEINPSLAMHGGYATLDRVEGSIAFITMGGGCQGCGLAQLTLTEGIKATIEQRIPEITEVVDVTDHAAGTNPFFEAAK
jgi:Fe/S biogenesis protein NfuA